MLQEQYEAYAPGRSRRQTQNAPMLVNTRPHSPIYVSFTIT